jgi:hypothetical protein
MYLTGSERLNIRLLNESSSIETDASTNRLAFQDSVNGLSVIDFSHVTAWKADTKFETVVNNHNAFKLGLLSAFSGVGVIVDSDSFGPTPGRYVDYYQILFQMDDGDIRNFVPLSRPVLLNEVTNVLDGLVAYLRRNFPCDH